MIDDTKTSGPCGRHGQRRCLMCGDLFRFHGPRNRVCPRCKLSRRWRDEEWAKGMRTIAAR